MKTYQECLELYMKVAREHGFEAHSYGNGIVVIVPRSDGSDERYVVTNIRELKVALGY